MSEETKEYKGIFKSTFLFSFVQVVRLLAGIIRNKVAAVILGPSGMGIIGVYNTTINFIKTGAGLGVSQSAVRDVSEANGCGDRERFSRTISLTNRIVWITAMLGLIVTLSLSPLLSKWGFGNASYTWAFVLLSFAVAADIFADNQLAILKGMRQLRSLAKASIIGSIAALVTGVPLFYLLGERGIVPSIILSAFTATAVSFLYVRKIPYERVSLTINETFHEGRSMLTMGISLMMVSFLAVVSNYVMIAFLRARGGLDVIGFYTAGSTIITSYFGIVINAMTTDYYPRISAINKDDKQLQIAVNQQTEVGLLLVFPLAILFLYLSRIIIRILYSSEFASVVDYTDYAMLGTIIMIASRCMSMVLLAKQNSKVFLSISVTMRILILLLSIVLFMLWGIRGLGIAYLTYGIIDLFVAMYFMNRLYRIRFVSRNIINLSVIIIFCVLAIIIRRIESGALVWGLGLFLLSIFYIYVYMKKCMHLNMLSVVTNFINKH